MKIEHIKRFGGVAIILTAALVAAAGAIVLLAQGQGQGRARTLRSNGMLDSGLLTRETPDFILKLVRSSQTAAALKPLGAAGFDFTPGGLLAERCFDGFYHLGDINLRLRLEDTGDWKNFTTAAARKPVSALPVKAPVLASADLGPSFGEGFPLKVVRTWLVENDRLILRFEISNPTGSPSGSGDWGSRWSSTTPSTTGSLRRPTSSARSPTPISVPMPDTSR